MEALKPLVVLVLFGTILYGAYSVVQKGPAPAAPTDQATDAPPFVPPQVDLSPSPVVAPPAAAVTQAPPAVAEATPAPATAVTAPVPPAAPPADVPAPPAAPPVKVPAEQAVVQAPAAAAPTYLAAESAPPPAQDAVAPAGAERPDRYAALAAPGLPVAPPAPLTAPPAAAAVASGAAAAFATAWAEAHDKLAATRYAEALATLSAWYDDPSLGLEESQRLEDLLGQLAGTVIYSTQDLLQPPYVVGAGETLPAIAGPLGVSWQLLAKINGVDDPLRLIPGEHLKVVQGPFDAVVSVSRRRLSLQLRGNYAGSFPATVGRQFLPRVGGALQVIDVRREPVSPADAAAGRPQGRRAIVLDDGLVIEAADEPAASDDLAPASLLVSARDMDDLIDILGPGSRILLRQ